MVLNVLNYENNYVESGNQTIVVEKNKEFADFPRGSGAVLHRVQLFAATPAFFHLTFVIWQAGCYTFPHHPTKPHALISPAVVCTPQCTLSIPVGFHLLAPAIKGAGRTQEV